MFRSRSRRQNLQQRFRPDGVGRNGPLALQRRRRCRKSEGRGQPEAAPAGSAGLRRVHQTSHSRRRKDAGRPSQARCCRFTFKYCCSYRCLEGLNLRQKPTIYNNLGGGLGYETVNSSLSYIEIQTHEAHEDLKQSSDKITSLPNIA